MLSISTDGGPQASIPQQWMERICAGSVQGVLSMYSGSAVLIPTYQYRVLRGHQELAEYFVKFTGERPGLCGVINTMVEQRVGMASIYSGKYTFAWRENGRMRSAPARYTFVAKPCAAGGMKIETHHSSEVP